MKLINDKHISVVESIEDYNSFHDQLFKEDCKLKKSKNGYLFVNGIIVERVFGVYIRHNDKCSYHWTYTHGVFEKYRYYDVVLPAEFTEIINIFKLESI